MELARHQLVWLDLTDPGALRFQNGADRPAAETWLQSNPAIIRRCEIGFDWGLPLGIPLPTRLDRRRIALFAPAERIVRTEPMPLLLDVIPTAPANWRAVLRTTHTQLSRCGAITRVYGSLGWQHVTGESYLRAQSDVDLLIEPGADFDIFAALETFRDLAAWNAPRFDGELLVGPDRTVSWREFDTAAPDIMVRSRTGLALEAKSSIIKRLSRAEAA